MKKSKALKVIICSMLALALLVTVPSGNNSISPLSNMQEVDL